MNDLVFFFLFLVYLHILLVVVMMDIDKDVIFFRNFSNSSTCIFIIVESPIYLQGVAKNSFDKIKFMYFFFKLS